MDFTERGLEIGVQTVKARRTKTGAGSGLRSCFARWFDSAQPTFQRRPPFLHRSSFAQRPRAGPGKHGKAVPDLDSAPFPSHDPGGQREHHRSYHACHLHASNPRAPSRPEMPHRGAPPHPIPTLVLGPGRRPRAGRLPASRVRSTWVGGSGANRGAGLTLPPRHDFYVGHHRHALRRVCLRIEIGARPGAGRGLGRSGPKNRPRPGHV